MKRERTLGIELRVPGSIRVSPFDGSTFFNRFLGGFAPFKAAQDFGTKNEKVQSSIVEHQQLAGPVLGRSSHSCPTSYSYSCFLLLLIVAFRTVSHGLARHFFESFLCRGPHLVHCVHPRPPRLLRHVSPFSSKLSRPHPTPSFLFFSSLRCLPYDGVLSSQGRPARFHPLTF